MNNNTETTIPFRQIAERILIKGLLVVLVLVIFLCGFAYLAVKMPGVTFSGELPPASPGLSALGQSLQAHVRYLSDDIGERSAGQHINLEKTADYIQQQFESFGYIPVNRTFGEEQFRNIEVDLYGLDLRNEIIVIGAHYDTRWRTPGADDNASGVAAMLEIARILKDQRYSRTIRFIAFANEEVSGFQRAQMGSMDSAKRSFMRNELVTAMISLEMLGYYSNQPGSQQYPWLMRWFYPDTGNFVAFISNLASRDLQWRAISYFREQATFPSEGLIAPEWLERSIRRSDHASYWYYDFPAIMVTDTAFLRNPNYHRPGDVYTTLDYDSMARVVSGLSVMIENLAQE